MESSNPTTITPLEFTFPSLYDGLQLKGRLYIPQKNLSNNISDHILTGAIVAHPYAPLGGSYDDPVVALVTETLLQCGVIVGTFNFRNASILSKSGTSLTATPETLDYISFRYLLVQYLCRRSQNHRQGSPNGKASGAGGDSNSPAEEKTTMRFQIIQGGYSYGSMIASRVGPWSDSDSDYDSESLSMSEHKEKGEAEEAHPSDTASQSRAIIRSIAADLAKMRGYAQRLSSTAAWERKKEQMEVPNHTSDPPDASNSNNNTTINDNFKTKLKIKTHYLLISPLLAPTTTLLAPLSSLPSFSSRSSWRPSTSAQTQTPTPPPTSTPIPTNQQHLADNPTLAIYGTSDVFASHTKLDRWAAELAGREGSRFKGVGVDGAGHFWAGDGDEVCRKLGNLVGEWVCGVVLGG